MASSKSVWKLLCALVRKGKHRVRQNSKRDKDKKVSGEARGRPKKL